VIGGLTLKVDLIDHMGSDLSVVNAARVSFDKRSETFTERDERLIAYLAEHEHTSPFRHAFVSFRIEAPLFVARQLQKHQVGLSWNEVSRRYVDAEPTFYKPHSWRKKAADKKQGSSDAVLEGYSAVMADGALGYVHAAADYAYRELLDQGVAPEQARMVLPQTLNTQWIWSGSLQAFAHVCNLRRKDDTQQETREIADRIHEHMQKLFPASWKALTR
jgi:thymidylate synthase (FAD)